MHSTFVRAARSLAGAFALAGLVTHPAAASVRSCEPDTAANHSRSLISGISAFHVDEGESAIPLNRDRVPALWLAMSMAFCRWPAYTVSAASELGMLGTPTDFALPTSGFHPPVFVNSSVWMLTRRWRRESIVHPMLSATVGTTHAEYDYVHFVNGVGYDSTTAGSSALFYGASAGAEASVFKYVTAFATVGERVVGHLNTPGVTGGRLSGIVTTFGLGFGKFR